MMKEYIDWCDECQVDMTRRSKDGRQVYCDLCWVPKPVPLTHLDTSVRMDEVRRLKTLAAQREAILAQ